MNGTMTRLHGLPLVLLFVLTALERLPQRVLSFGSLEELYKVARQQRILKGHAAAQPLYAEILRRNPSDATLSTRLAASNGTLLECVQTACAGSRLNTTKRLTKLKEWFVDSNFTNLGVKEVLDILHGTNSACAPIYVTPAAAGTVQEFPFSNHPTAANVLTALFLLGVAVPMETVASCCSTDEVQRMLDGGLVCRCDHDRKLLVGVVMIMPMELAHNSNKHLYVVTDWHPRVLNSVGIEMPDGSVESAVMYIGPDSLALVQHWILHPNLRHDGGALLDLCTGSGVQALAALTVQQCNQAVLVDVSRRALRFAAFSAALNGLSSLTFVQGDLLTGKGRIVSDSMGEFRNLTELLLQLCTERTDAGCYDWVTANPPFLPVPDQTVNEYSGVETISARHGLFSAGGPSGEDVLAKILSLSSRLLKDNGYAAVVSEFFFDCKQEDKNAAKDLMSRLMLYWTRTRQSKGLLLTNEFPISSSIYAQRRADTQDEARVWKLHLEKQGIAACSPGLLYVQKSAYGGAWKHSVVPKSELGSIWTPSNLDALRFSQGTSRDFFGLHAVAESRSATNYWH